MPPPKLLPSSLRPRLIRPSRPRRPYSTKPPSPPSTATTRAARIIARLPPSLQNYAFRLRDAPVSHVVAFLILHEITAVIPLLSLFGALHYYGDRLPVGWAVDRYGGYVREGAARFERYFRRKGWFGFGKGEEVAGREDGKVVWKWEQVDGKYKVVMEVAVAWAITKVLLPVRIVASLWATPWFAGVLGRVKRLARFGR